MRIPLLTDPEVLRYVYCIAPYLSRLLLWNTLAPIKTSKRCYLGYAFWEPNMDIRPLFSGRLKTPRGMPYDSNETLALALVSILCPKGTKVSVHQLQWMKSPTAVDFRTQLTECSVKKQYADLFFDIDNRTLTGKH